MCKGDKLYAFLLNPADNKIAVIKSLDETNKVKSAKLLGGGTLHFTQDYGVLTVKLPEKLPTEYTICLEFSLA